MFDLAIAILIGFPFGVLVGYLWRDRISRARRARYRAEQEMRRSTDK
jgi:NhaP-type Na+/H+ or K+/H+ antiporter